METTRPPTIKDLARELNLSVSTVSYALNDGPRPVSQEVKDRVAAVAERLGYRPSRIARTLVTGLTHTLGIVIPAADGQSLLAPYHHIAIRAFASTLEELGYDMLMYTRPERLQRETLIQSFIDGRTDGLVVANPSLDLQVIEELAKAGFPCALVSRRVDLDIPQFLADNRNGIRQALDHLCGLGHRRIGYVHGNLNQYDAVKRLEAYQEYLDEQGLEAIYAPGNFSEGMSREATRRMVSSHRPSAILAGNDQSALGILRGVQDLGLSVPEDVSVVGYDDMPMAPLQNPPLTTIRQPVYAMASDAVRYVVSLLEGKPIRVPSLYSTELVVRESCAPPRNA